MNFPSLLNRLWTRDSNRFCEQIQLQLARLWTRNSIRFSLPNARFWSARYIHLTPTSLARTVRGELMHSEFITHRLRCTDGDVTRPGAWNGFMEATPSASLKLDIVQRTFARIRGFTGHLIATSFLCPVYSATTHYLGSSSWHISRWEYACDVSEDQGVPGHYHWNNKSPLLSLIFMWAG